jgi:hypothetical protein
LGRSYVIVHFKREESAGIQQTHMNDWYWWAP